MSGNVKLPIKEKVARSVLGTSSEEGSKEARSAFMKHAVLDRETNEHYLGERQFVDAITPQKEDYHKIKREQYAILFKVADHRRVGRITLADWIKFENLLAKPDADYEIAFRLFDMNGDGVVTFQEFKDLYELNKSDSGLPFDWESEWARLYIGGRNKRHAMTYHQFSQLLRGLQGERVRQAFQHFDRNGDGFIEPEDFQKIILEISRHKLSDHLLENLHTLCNISTTSKISYATVRAFQNVIREMDLVELVISSATRRTKDGKITRADFLNEASRVSRFSLFTPMEADILFHFAGMGDSSGRLGLSDFAKVLDASWQAQSPLNRGVSSREESDDKNALGFSTKNLLHDILESVHHFALGSIAGAFGAFMVYPIDLVKTRMQNQRGTQVGQMLYTNSLDCAKKVIKNEGLKGLYSGVMPQMVGVAPEKAIKLTVNDLIRGKFTDKKTGNIWWGYEILAGGAAGGCQVIFTNPLEIVKIRLQVQGEATKGTAVTPKRSAFWIIKNLGLMGLYKGASACLLRDIPFSAIYFPAYSHLKRDLFGESPQKKLGVFQLLTAGAIAGMPAAYLTTPFDVIKTRLQVEARKGEQVYTTLRHCAKTVYKQEGFKAFFKGGPARIMRSSPQFGFTLAGYEVLQKLLPLPGQQKEEALLASPSTERPVGALEIGSPLGSHAPLPFINCRNALKIILDLDSNFGLPTKANGLVGRVGWITDGKHAAPSLNK